MITRFVAIVLTATVLSPTVAPSADEESGESFAAVASPEAVPDDSPEHCVLRLPQSNSVTALSASTTSTCFDDYDKVMDHVGGLTRATASSSQPDRIIGVHFQQEDFKGDSITVVGKDCAGGGITLTYTKWNNWIRSTANGCDRIEHFDDSDHYVFDGEVEATLGIGGNLARLKATTSGILYKGNMNPSLRVVALEVNQVIQTWDGLVPGETSSIPLIAGNRTVVRAFVEPKSSSVTEATIYAQLYIKRPGQQDVGTVLPYTGKGVLNDNTVPVDPIVNVDHNGESRRHKFHSAINFLMPEAYLHGDNVTLELRLPGQDVVCTEASVPTNTCS